MTFTGINYLAVVIAAAAAFVFSGIYYRVVGDAWMKAIGFNKKSMANKSMRTPLLIAAIADLIMAWVLAGLVAHLGPGQVTAQNGIVSGAFVWLGFVATTIAVSPLTMSRFDPEYVICRGITRSTEACCIHSSSGTLNAWAPISAAKDSLAAISSPIGE